MRWINQSYFKNWLFLIPLSSSFLFLWTTAEVSRNERVAESPRSNAPSPTPREGVENAAGVNHEFAFHPLNQTVSTPFLHFDPHPICLLARSPFWSFVSSLSSPFPFFFPFRLYLLYTRFLRSISFKEAWIIVSYFLSYPLPPLFSTKYFKCIIIFHFFYRPHEILSYFGNRLNRRDGNIDSELSFLDVCERWKKVRLEIVDHFYDKIKSWMTREWFPDRWKLNRIHWYYIASSFPFLLLLLLLR